MEIGNNIQQTINITSTNTLIDISNMSVSERVEIYKNRTSSVSMEDRFSVNSNGYFYNNYQANKIVKHISDEVIDELNNSGKSPKQIEKSFQENGMIGTMHNTIKNDNIDEQYKNKRENFENSNIIIGIKFGDNGQIEGPQLREGMEHRRESLPSHWKNMDAYKNFEVPNDINIHQGYYIKGSNDKDTLFSEIMFHAYMNNASEEDINSKEFQRFAIEKHNGMLKELEKVSFHTFNNTKNNTYDLGFQVSQKSDSEIEESFRRYSNPTIQEVKDSYTPVIFEMDSHKSLLENIEQTKDYLKNSQNEYTNLNIEYLNRMEDKLSKIDVFSMTQENKPSMKIFYDGKVENDRIVGTLYG
jgi:hypothetical protein